MHRVKIAPRREAQAFKWSELDQSQKEALAKAVILLNDYTVNAQKKSSSEKTKIQKHHRAQIIFIDGKRGTGKTSVLTTLIYTTEEAERWKEFSQDLDTSNALEREVLDISAGQLKSICWLNTLDLEMLPEPTNLLASLCVRIEETFKNSTNTPFYTSQLVGKKERDAWRKFSDLMNSFALGWKTNLQERKEVDPDTYSSEVLRVERARMQLDHFPEILSNLGEFYKTTYNLSLKPLFVLPVDDADLNPQRFLDLLDLTRRAKAPNLVFLVLGNYDNLSQLLEWKYASEISEMLPSKDNFNVASIYATQMVEYSTHWAYSALQKLVPPGNHLIKLEAYSFEEASRHTSEGCEFNLKALLEKALLPKPAGAIKDYLSPHSNIWELITFSEWKNSSRFIPQQTSILSGPIRAIENLSRETVSFLNELPDEPSHLIGEVLLDAIRQFLKKAFEGAIFAEPGLPHRVRQRLTLLFYPVGTIPNPKNTEKTVEVSPSRLPIYHDASDSFSANSNHCVYTFRKCDGFILRIPEQNFDQPPQNANKEYYNLTDWRANWLFLYHDINLLYPGNTIERLNFSNCTQYWASSSCSTLSENQLLISWPVPNWLLFNHLEMFRIYWNSILEHNDFSAPEFDTRTAGSTQIRKKHLEFAAYLWCKAINDVIQKQKLDLSVDLVNYHENSRSLWFTLIQSMQGFQNMTIDARVEGISGLRKRYMAEWLNDFVILFSPEFGIFKADPLLEPVEAPSSSNTLTNLISSSNETLKNARINHILNAIKSKPFEEKLELIKNLGLDSELSNHWFELASNVKTKEVMEEVLKRIFPQNGTAEQHKNFNDLKSKFNPTQTPATTSPDQGTSSTSSEPNQNEGTLPVMQPESEP